MSFTPFFDRSLYTVQILFVSKIPRSQFTQKRSTSDKIEAKHDLIKSVPKLVQLFQPEVLFIESRKNFFNSC